jgi:hypothetical protein
MAVSGIRPLKGLDTGQPRTTLMGSVLLEQHILTLSLVYLLFRSRLTLTWISNVRIERGSIEASLACRVTWPCDDIERLMYDLFLNLRSLKPRTLLLRLRVFDLLSRLLSGS